MCWMENIAALNVSYITMFWLGIISKYVKFKFECDFHIPDGFLFFNPKVLDLTFCNASVKSL